MPDLFDLARHFTPEERTIQSTVRSFLARVAESLENENLSRWPAVSRFQRD